MYDWLSFFDIDGYLQLIQPNLKIQHFLNNYKTNNSLYYENKSLIKWANIPNFNISVNLHIKSTVRGNLSKNYWKDEIKAILWDFYKSIFISKGTPTDAENIDAENIETVEAEASGKQAGWAFPYRYSLDTARSGRNWKM